MPIYLVRWPELRASLVRAHDEDDLMARLDECADPEGCTFEIYRGPLWIDLHVPVEFVAEYEDSEIAEVLDDIDPAKVEEICTSLEFLCANLPGTWDSFSMVQRILKSMFPALYQVAQTPHEQFDPAEVLAALKEELQAGAEND